MEKVIGYRNEMYGNSAVVDLVSIVEFEIEELGNQDIIDYMNTNYLEDGEVCEYKPAFFIMKLLAKHFGTDKLYGLWLGSKETVLAMYTDLDEKENIVLENLELREYILPKDAVPISDLGSGSGILYASTINPREWKNRLIEGEEL